MGVKRPFEEEFEEASLKQAKQLDSDNKLTSFVGGLSSHDASQANDFKGKTLDLISLGMSYEVQGLAPTLITLLRSLLVKFYKHI